MPQLDSRTPRPGDLWLSRPPYLLVAHVLSVERHGGRGVVSYELADEDGTVLEHVDALLDAGWWQTFQPMVRRYG